MEETGFFEQSPKEKHRVFCNCEKCIIHEIGED